MTSIDKVMRMAPVIPVLVLDDGGVDPVALAEILVENGLPVIEVTLRTPNALAAMKAMAKVHGAFVGAGTVTSADQFRQVVDEGAKFVVSPGLTEKLGRAALDANTAYLPGIANSADILLGMELGFDRFKFFPAEANGGLKALASLAGPFFGARFCPTGGVTEATAPAWLAHPSVLCVGGSWILPAGDTDLDAIAQRARRASKLAT